MFADLESAKYPRWMFPAYFVVIGRYASGPRRRLPGENVTARERQPAGWLADARWARQPDRRWPRWTAA